MDVPEKIKSKFKFLTKLNRTQKLSLLTFLFILFVLPLSVIAALNPVIFNQRAVTVMTPPGSFTPSCPENIMCVVGFHACAGKDGCPSCCSDTIPPPASTLNFPNDHGSHPSFKAEWWYLNLLTRTTKTDGTDQRDLAYVISFSRILGSNNLLSSRYDNTSKSFKESTEQAGSLTVQLTDGSRLLVQFSKGLVLTTLEELATGSDRKKVYHLTGRTANMGSFDLTLKERTVVSSGFNTPLLWGGTTGNCQGKISVFAQDDTYYYSVPDLDIIGSITDLDGTRRNVLTGKAWIDHQWFNSSPPPDWRGHYWTNFHFTNSSNLYNPGPHQAFGFVTQIYSNGSKYPYWVKRNADGTNECGTSGTLVVKSYGSTNYPNSWNVNNGSFNADGYSFSDNQIFQPPIGPKFIEVSSYYSGNLNGTPFTGLGFFETHLVQPSATPTPTSVIPTPSPTPTPTRAPIPTPTKAPIPTPTKPIPTFMPTPFPTPVPVPNQNPVIQTTSLPAAQWLSDYKASVSGYDYDVNDTLTMQITGLPLGLSQAPCNSWKTIDKSQVGCAIYGRPYGIGTYRVNVTIKDNKEGITSSVFNLTVSVIPTPSPRPTSTPTPGPFPIITMSPTITITPTKATTPTPAPTRAPIPTFMPTPFPTPVPVPNQNPVIQTTSLPAAQWLSDYKASVSGYDYDVNDTLTMQITGLPLGLSQAPCNSWKTIDKSQVGCAIYGRSYVIGTYKVTVTIKDNKEGITSSVFNLTVNSPLPRLALPWTFSR